MNVNCPKRNTCNCPNKHLQGRPDYINFYRMVNPVTKKVVFETQCFAEAEKLKQENLTPPYTYGADV